MTLHATTTFHPDGTVTIETDEGTRTFPDQPSAAKHVEASLERIYRLCGDARSLDRLVSLRLSAEIS